MSRTGTDTRTQSGWLVVLAKAPRAGQVKTRMVPPLTPAQAAEFYASLLEDVLRATARFACDLGLLPVVSVNPPDACAEIARMAPASFRVVAQRGGSLSERMTWAVREAAASGATRILLRGSDSPALGGQTVAHALRDLETSDLVVCPDLDGGYSLIGLRRPASGLFDHPMSTRTALDDTLARAAELGLRTRIQAPSFDLDTIEDLRPLADLRSHPDTLDLCKHTLAYIDRHDLWRHLARPIPSRGPFSA